MISPCWFPHLDTTLPSGGQAAGRTNASNMTNSFFVLSPHGERLQILVVDQGMVLAVGREIGVYPELL